MFLIPINIPTFRFNPSNCNHMSTTSAWYGKCGRVVNTTEFDFQLMNDKKQNRNMLYCISKKLTLLQHL